MDTATLTRPDDTVPTAPVVPLTRVQILDVILTVFRDHGLPAPQDITLWHHYLGVDIRLPDNERGQVDAWMTALRLPVAPVADVESVLYAGEPTAFIRYGTGDGYRDGSPLLPGVQVGIRCFVRTAADPHVHGDTFTLPPAGGVR